MLQEFEWSSRLAQNRDEETTRAVYSELHNCQVRNVMRATSPKVHVHTSSPEAFFVNSFISEGERSLILIDTQFVLSEARAVANMIAALRKPLAAIFVTHPHPDHSNGIVSILEKHPGTRVHATAATIEETNWFRAIKWQSRLILC